LVTVEWQKYYDEAVAGEKSGNPAAASVVLLGGVGGGAAVAGGAGQGWNTVTGGKGVNKSSNPWGNQNRTVPPSPSNAESLLSHCSHCSFRVPLWAVELE